MVNIAIDAMGSDDACRVEVEACNAFVKTYSDVVITLYGKSEEIKKYLEPSDRILVVHCQDVISAEEEASLQIRKQKDASLVVALNSLKDETNDCIVSAGSTAGLIAGSVFIVKRINGVKRPALAPLIPSKSSKKIMLDVGANIDCSCNYLVQNAVMGSVYAKCLGESNPKVGLLNIGSESKKGTEEHQKAFKALSELETINFVGNIEGRDILTSDVHVVVADGFSGNIALKTIEGTALYVGKLFKDAMLASFKNKLAALVLKKDLDTAKKALDYHETGGSIVLGISKPVVKAHGSSNSYSFHKAIELAYELTKNQMVSKIEGELNGKVVK